MDDCHVTLKVLDISIYCNLAFDQSSPPVPKHQMSGILLQKYASVAFAAQLHTFKTHFTIKVILFVMEMEMRMGVVVEIESNGGAQFMNS